MPAVLITLQQAKDQTGRLAADQESDLLLKTEAATDVVIDYIKRPDHGWTERTVPPVIRSAILLVLSSLCNEAGDGTGEALSQNVKDLVWRYRDPALA